MLSIKQVIMFEESSLILTSCALGLLLILIVWLVGGKSRRPLSRLPHPPRWPLVGNALQMTSHGRSDQQLETWAKQYGPVFTVQIFNMTWVVVSGADELHEMLVTKSRAFSGRYKWFRVSKYVLDNKDIVMGNPTNPQWLPMRKALHRTIQPIGCNLTRIESVLLELSQQLVTQIKSHKGKAVDLKDDIYNFVCKVAVAILIGQNVEDNDELLVEMKLFDKFSLEALSPMSGVELDVWPWLRHFGHSRWKKLQQLMHVRDILYSKFLNAGAATYSPEDRPTCIIHAVAQMFDKTSQYYEPTMTQENAIALVTDVINGSITTTTSTAYALINQLVHNPRVYKRLQQEADTIIGHDRLPNISDRDVMPYSTATIFEILRLQSTFPILFPHMTLENTTLGQYDIPANTIIVPLVCYLHHDASLWGNPLVFRPERFLDDNGKLVPPEHPNRKHLMPFGAGIRECAGEVFALRRLFFLVTSVVLAFDIEGGEVSVSCDPADYEDGAIVTQKPYTVRLIPRQSE